MTDYAEKLALQEAWAAKYDGMNADLSPTKWSKFTAEPREVRVNFSEPIPGARDIAVFDPFTPATFEIDLDGHYLVVFP